MNLRKALLIAWFLLGGGYAFAQSAPDNHEPIAVVEIGGATGVSLSDSTSASGATAAVETTPIENRLELEAGVTVLFARHSTEWDVDLLFKKPWTLSRKVEFMAGAGPEWVRTSDRGVKANSVAGEVIADFMFWPFAKHKFGWYLEPGYEYNFGAGHEQSIGVSGGLLIAIP